MTTLQAKTNNQPPRRVFRSICGLQQNRPTTPTLGRQCIYLIVLVLIGRSGLTARRVASMGTVREHTICPVNAAGNSRPAKRKYLNGIGALFSEIRNYNLLLHRRCE